MGLVLGVRPHQILVVAVPLNSDSVARDNTIATKVTLVAAEIAL